MPPHVKTWHNVFKTYVQNVFLRRLQDVFKTFSRRFQDVFARRLPIMSSRQLQDVLKDKKMLHWRRLQDVFKTSSVRLHQDECLLGYYSNIFTIILLTLLRMILTTPLSPLDWPECPHKKKNAIQDDVAKSPVLLVFPM